MESFTSIKSFRRAIKSVHRYCDTKFQSYPTILYKGTVKLHGTNAGIRRTPSGKLVPQSRSRILDLQSDNYSFAFFVETHKQEIEKLFNDNFDAGMDVTLYGEWCGEGVQKGVALAEVPKHFVVFSAMVDGSYVPNRVEWQNNDINIYNVLQIPQYTVEVDYKDPAPASEILSKLTMEVEETCPWAKQMFGVEGIGEGIVWVPVGLEHVTDLWFKTKGLKHKGNDKTKQPKIEISPEKYATMNAITEAVLPQWRLEQGISQLKEQGLPVLPESTSPYLKWVANDILKEELDVLKENNVEWRQIQGFVMKAARLYFLKECENAAY